MFQPVNFRSPIEPAPALIPIVRPVDATTAAAIEDPGRYGFHQHREYIRPQVAHLHQVAVIERCGAGKNRNRNLRQFPNPVFEKYEVVVIGSGMADHVNAHTFEMFAVIADF